MTDYGNDQKLPLEGLTVLDLTRLLPGPLSTMLLGDYGADVLKVEDIHAGDPTRFVGKVFKGSGTFYRQLNRNKKSIALNLKSEQGREIINKLVAGADVLVEGFRPGVMERLGLSYRQLNQVNRRLVYASISGYGQEGPYRERAGHDINYTALSGILDLSATVNSGPVMPSVQIADLAGGSLMALNGIMIALFERERTGVGRYVDVSMSRGLLPWLVYAAAFAGGSDQDIPRRGSGHITGAYACYNIYETADRKQMSLGALEPTFWQRFCEAIGKPEWVPLQFEKEGRSELIEAVEKIFKTKTREQWEEFFLTVDACCEPVLNLNEAIKHPVSRSGNYWIDDPDGDGELLTGFPLLLSGQSGKLRYSPPQHGEHSAEILLSLGYSEKDIAALKNSGVIKTL